MVLSTVWVRPPPPGPFKLIAKRLLTHCEFSALPVCSWLEGADSPTYGRTPDPALVRYVPRSTEILDGLAVRSSEEIIRGAAEHKLECSFVAFCRSNVKRGQAIQQIDLPEVARVRNSDLRKGKCTRASIVFQPKLRALAAGKSPFITSSEDRPRARPGRTEYRRIWYATLSPSRDS